ncbi:hypothetical protein [Chelonobacter oris]|nr:hypothetical protein [Chelonobacter oris]
MKWVMIVFLALAVAGCSNSGVNGNVGGGSLGVGGSFGISGGIGF